MNPILSDYPAKQQDTKAQSANPENNAQFDSVLSKRIQEVRQGKVKLVKASKTAATIHSRHNK